MKRLHNCLRTSIRVQVDTVMCVFRDPTMSMLKNSYRVSYCKLSLGLGAHEYNSCAESHQCILLTCCN